MNKKNRIRLVLFVAIVSVYAIFSFIIIFSFINFLMELKSNQYQSIDFIRQLDEEEQAKLYLYNAVKYDFRRFLLYSKIIYCESKWQQSAINNLSRDYGLWQINFASWSSQAKILKLDYQNSWKDNLELGLWIMENGGGLKNWSWSRHCWNK